MKRVCFLVNYNQYESKRHFTEKFAEAMECAGVEAKIFDVNESKIHERLIEEIIDYDADFTLSFNSFMPLPDNSYLWDLTETPHLSMLLDPSLYSVQLIDSPYSIISCVDQYDCYGLSTQNFDRVFFLPHAIERDLFERETEQEREYEVVFLGSCYDYETMRTNVKMELPEAVATALEKACDILLSEVEVPLQQALIMAWRDVKISEGEEEIDLLQIFTYLDKISRGLDRVELIRSIKGAKVHIFGELFEDDKNGRCGWKELLADKDNVVIHDAVTYEESLQILQKSKICLNSSPFFKGGAHERIFAGLASGALVITTDNIYLRDIFREDEMLYYRPFAWEEVNRHIDRYLSDEAARGEFVARGREKVRRHHTWDQRVALLKEVMPAMIEKCRLTT